MLGVRLTIFVGDNEEHYWLELVELLRLLLQQCVWYLNKVGYVTCSWLLEYE
jgi:hypothetical protein